MPDEQADLPALHGWRAPMRGDFMRLPGMRTAVHRDATQNLSPAGYAVTRRPVAVTSAALAHSVVPMLTGRVRMLRVGAPVAAFDEPELVPLTEPADVDEPAAPIHASAPVARAPQPVRARKAASVILPGDQPRSKPRRRVGPPAAPKPAPAASAAEPHRDIAELVPVTPEGERLQWRTRGGALPAVATSAPSLPEQSSKAMEPRPMQPTPAPAPPALPDQMHLTTTEAPAKGTVDLVPRGPALTRPDGTPLVTRTRTSPLTRAVADAPAPETARASAPRATASTDDAPTPQDSAPAPAHARAAALPTTETAAADSTPAPTQADATSPVPRAVVTPRRTAIARTVTARSTTSPSDADIPVRVPANAPIDIHTDIPTTPVAHAESAIGADRTIGDGTIADGIQRRPHEDSSTPTVTPASSTTPTPVAPELTVRTEASNGSDAGEIGAVAPTQAPAAPQPTSTARTSGGAARDAVEAESPQAASEPQAVTPAPRAAVPTPSALPRRTKAPTAPAQAELTPRSAHTPTSASRGTAGAVPAGSAMTSSIPSPAPAEGDAAAPARAGGSPAPVVLSSASANETPIDPASRTPAPEGTTTESEPRAATTSPHARDRAAARAADAAPANPDLPHDDADVAAPFTAHAERTATTPAAIVTPNEMTRLDPEVVLTPMAQQPDAGRPAVTDGSAPLVGGMAAASSGGVAPAAANTARADQRGGDAAPEAVTLTPTRRSQTRTPAGVQRRAAASAHAEPVDRPVLPKQAPSTMLVPSEVADAVQQVTGTTIGAVPARTGQAVQRAATGMKADAFTVDGIVHLPRSGHAHSDEDRRVLAHELTHVAQQRRLGSALPHESSAHGQALEAEARRAEELLAPRQAPASAGSTAASSSTAGTVSAPDPASPSRARTPSAAPAPARSTAAGADPRAAHDVELIPRSAPAPVLTPSRATPASAAVLGSSTPSARPAPVVSQGAGGSAAGSSSPAPSADAPTGDGVQRRASASSAPASPKRAPSPAPMPAPAPQAADTARDQQWLERHAEALYPLIRQQLRAELFRDRERRGRLMRDP